MKGVMRTDPGISSGSSTYYSTLTHLNLFRSLHTDIKTSSRFAKSISTDVKISHSTELALTNIETSKSVSTNINTFHLIKPAPTNVETSYSTELVLTNIETSKSVSTNVNTFHLTKPTLTDIKTILQPSHLSRKVRVSLTSQIVEFDPSGPLKVVQDLKAYVERPLPTKSALITECKHDTLNQFSKHHIATEKDVSVTSIASTEIGNNEEDGQIDEDLSDRHNVSTPLSHLKN
jgi:hypothetical protein